MQESHNNVLFTLKELNQIIDKLIESLTSPSLQPSHVKNLGYVKKWIVDINKNISKNVFSNFENVISELNLEPLRLNRKSIDKWGKVNSGHYSLYKKGNMIQERVKKRYEVIKKAYKSSLIRYNMSDEYVSSILYDEENSFKEMKIRTVDFEQSVIEVVTQLSNKIDIMQEKMDSLKEENSKLKEKNASLRFTDKNKLSPFQKMKIHRDEINQLKPLKSTNENISINTNKKITGNC